MNSDLKVFSSVSFPAPDSLALVADIQFNEPYVSSGLNRKFRGIVDAGFYSGFTPKPGGGMTLLITSADTGNRTGAASVNIGEQYQITIQQRKDVQLQLSAGKNFAIVLKGVYLLGEDTYQVNASSSIQAAEISARIYNDTYSLGDGELLVCTVRVPAGAKAITESMIDTSARINCRIGIEISDSLTSERSDVAASSKAAKRLKDLVDTKAPLDSPALIGTPTAPTPAASAKGFEIATAAFVRALIAALVDSVPESLDTLKELADALGNDPNFSTTVLNALAGKQPLDQTLTNLSGKDINGLIQYLDLVETINKAAGAVQRTGDTMGGDLNLPNLYAKGIIKSGGEVQTTSANAYRIIYGDYGAFWHQNGTYLYLMLTNRGDPYGGFNGLRPLVINLATGDVTMTNGATIHNLRANGRLSIGTDNQLGTNSLVIGDSDTGFKQEGDGILNVYANSALVMRFISSLIESLKPLKVNGNCIATGEIQAGNGSARLASDGNVYGAIWGNRWLRDYLVDTFQPKGNYATQAWVLQNFVQNIDHTAPIEAELWDGRGYLRPTDGAAMYNLKMVGGASNVGNFILRYTRKLVNGTWYIIN